MKKLFPFKGRVASSQRQTVFHLEQRLFLQEENVLLNAKVASIYKKKLQGKVLLTPRICNYFNSQPF